MPNRIIKESICDSEKLAALSDFEFRLWVGLITQADDAGRGDARPAYIKGHVFPFRERVTTKDISVALHALAAVSCVTLYTVGGRPYPIQSEYNPNPNPKYIGTEPQAASMPPVIFLPLNDGTDYPVSQEQCHEWAGLYPAVDVIQQLRQMRAWLIANPRRRKTARGINGFIVNWLSREQDKPGRKSTYSAETQQKQGRKSWTDICEEMEGTT